MQTTEYLASRSHEAAIEGLAGAIRDNSEVLALTGETGSGKTTVLRRLSDELTGTARPVYCPASGLDFTQILNVVCSDLQIPFKGPTRRSELDAITQAIADSPLAPVALLVDDADRLHGDALNQLLRLVRAIRRFRGQFHLVLSGLPTLQERLKRASASHPSAAQAVFARLTRLTHGQATALLESLAANRLATSDLHVPAATLRRISELGEGVPGKLVAMFDAALRRAEQGGEGTLSTDPVERAASETQDLAGSADRLLAPAADLPANADRPRPDASHDGSTALSASAHAPKNWRIPFALGTLASVAAAAVALGLFTNARTANAPANPSPLATGRAEAATPRPSAEVAPTLKTTQGDAPDIAALAAAQTSAPVIEVAAAKPQNSLPSPVQPLPTPRLSLSAEEVRTNLDRAWATLRRNALTTPQRDNAVHWAETVLADTPDQAEAINIVRAVIDKYLRWTDSHLEQRDVGEAARYLDKARSLETRASAEQIDAMKVLGSEVATQERRLAKANAKRPRENRARRYQPEAPKWLSDLERWVETLPLPR